MRQNKPKSQGSGTHGPLSARISGWSAVRGIEALSAAVAGMRTVLGPLSRRQRAPIAAAYVSTLYYCEIIYLMIAVLFAYGKILSVVLGGLLSLLLAVQIVGLYYRKDLYRKTMLICIDLHVPLTIAFFYNMSTMGFDANRVSVSLIFLRIALVILELPLLWLLTDDEVKRQFR